MKRAIFAELDRAAPPHTVLASNSSTISISKIAGATQRPDCCVNMHFFYPVLVMDLVEIVRGPQTSDETVARAIGLARDTSDSPDDRPMGQRKSVDSPDYRDVTYNARLHMYRTTGDERYKPSAQLEAKVKAGKLGRKTGEGWYRY